MIDSDALKSALAHAAKDYCNRNGPMRTIDYESLIDKAPTVDAIPVEWLGKIQEGCVCDVVQMPMYIAIGWLVDMWRQEQEAR